MPSLPTHTTPRGDRTPRVPPPRCPRATPAGRPRRAPSASARAPSPHRTASSRVHSAEAPGRSKIDRRGESISIPSVRANRLTSCLFNSCANHDESGGAHAGQDPHGHGHGHGTNDSSSTVFGALGPPGSTLPGFTGVVPSSLDELFDTLELVDHAGEKLDPAVHFKGKVIGVYFSSGTCPGCVRFSPSLNAFTEINARDYVTVLVPGDRDESAARAYANRYPAFASVPYNR